MTADEKNTERLDALESLLISEADPEWIVFSLRASSGKLEMREVAQVKAVDADLALVIVAEDNPAQVTSRMCALAAGTVRGRKVTLTHRATVGD